MTEMGTVTGVGNPAISATATTTIGRGLSPLDSMPLSGALGLHLPLCLLRTYGLSLVLGLLHALRLNLPLRLLRAHRLSLPLRPLGALGLRLPP